MKLLQICFLFCYIHSTSSMQLSAQTTVVLSGGGSKAFMHLGVLQLLEDNKIAIKNIGGASMGSFIAALYASGYSIEEIKKIITSPKAINASNGIFNPRLQTNFYDLNEDYKPFSVDFESLKNIGSIFPTAVINSAPLQFLLLQCFAPLSNTVIENYDSLMLPLRIVASEIQQKKLFVFKKGPLAKMVRASMSYPFYLEAVEIGDSLIFMDGGLYNNFPIIELVNEFQSSSVIGSLSSLPILKTNSKNIISQFLTLISRNNDYSLPKGINGLVIQHDVKNVSTFDFSAAEVLIQKGTNEAKNWTDSIQKLQLPTFTKNLQEIRKQFVQKNRHAVLFDSLEIETSNVKQKKYLKSLLNPHVKIWDLELMEKRFARFAKDSRFSEPDFSTSFLNNDSVGIFKIKVAPIKKYSFLLGLNLLIGSIGGNFEFFAGARSRFFINRFLFDVQGNFVVGNYENGIEGRCRIDVPAKIPTYFLWRVKYFYDNFFTWQSSFLKTNNPDYLLFNNLFSEFSYTVPLTRKTNLQVGIYNFYANIQYYLDSKIRIGGDSTDKTKLFGHNLFAELCYNKLNYYIFPTAGMKLLFRATYLDYRYQTNYIHLNDVVDKNENKKYNNWVLESSFEGYTKLFNRFKVGIDCRAVWSNISVQKDYYSTLMMLPYFNPVRMLKNTLNADYVSDKFFSIGAKLILHPLKNYDKLALRLENYHFIKANEIQKTPNNGVNLLKPILNKQWGYKLLQYMIIDASLIWTNKIVPISFSTVYLTSSENKGLNFYLSVGYSFQDKKRTFY